MNKNQKTKILYEGYYNDYDLADGELLILIGNHHNCKFLKNGTDLLYEGPYFSYYWSNGELLILLEYYSYKFLKNGTQILYQGPWDDFCFSHGELLIRKGDMFLKNGTQILYQGLWDDFCFSHGELLVLTGDYSEHKFLKNGTDLLFSGFHGDYSWSKGKLLLETSSSDDDSSFFLIDTDVSLKKEMIPLYKGKWYYFSSTDAQLLICAGSRIFGEFVKNGKDLLYQGPWDEVHWGNGSLLLRIGEGFYTPI